MLLSSAWGREARHGAVCVEVEVEVEAERVLLDLMRGGTVSCLEPRARAGAGGVPRYNQLLPGHDQQTACQEGRDCKRGAL